MGGGSPVWEGYGVAALAKVQTRGQFTIPDVIRKATGAQPGNSLLVRATGPDTFEVRVLPQITADDFIAAMALRSDLTQDDLHRAVEEGIERRVLPAGDGALAEVAAAREEEAHR